MENEFREGDLVKHPKYGEGKVTNVSCDGDSYPIKVQFSYPNFSHPKSFVEDGRESFSETVPALTFRNGEITVNRGTPERPFIPSEIQWCKVWNDDDDDDQSAKVKRQGLVVGYDRSQTAPYKTSDGVGFFQWKHAEPCDGEYLVTSFK
ncbi:MAG: hypothetical protein R8M45_05425 [Ghiorsea sp.]